MRRGEQAPGGLAPAPEDLLGRAAAVLEEWALPGLRPVLNLTGVVIHTNLGRAPLSEAAVEQVVQVARSYSNLEYDVGAGARGSRESYVEDLLTRLTGAEAGFVVNNNAGAVLLLLMALASGREVIVSRGQLVEIGGSFRLPDIMRAGGVSLVEVGTTNRTRVEDYEAAITAETALLLRVHTSNYRIMGFTEEADLGELVGLGRGRGVIVADDLGSGALHDLDAFQGEPTVAASLRAGVDVVCFSGDKLLGGPQAGILVGRREIIDRLRKHPVARALRLDKMTLAALEATLRAYQDPERARRDIPVLRSLTRTPAETAALAGRLLAAIDRRSAGGFILEVEESSARAGGGSMPLTEVPSHAVRIRFPERSPAVATIENALRRAPVPVVARVSQDSLHLDVLALDERDLEAVADSVAWAIDRVARLGDQAAPPPDCRAPRVGSWPDHSAPSPSGPPVISTTARRPWSKRSPAATPTGSRRRRSAASASSWALPSWRSPAAGISASSTSPVTSASSRPWWRAPPASTCSSWW